MKSESALESKPGMVSHCCNPSTQEAKEGGSGVLGQSGIHSETLSQKQNNGHEAWLK
jgi:hypothetical protein